MTAKQKPTDYFGLTIPFLDHLGVVPEFAENGKPVSPSIGIEDPQDLVFDAIRLTKLSDKFFVQMLGYPIDRDRTT